MRIFSGSSNKPLAETIAKALKIKLSELEVHVFPDEEKRIRVIDKVLEEDCIVVQSTSTNADINYMELFFIVDALKRSGAKSVTAVIPYLGYQRQDHVFREGEAVSLGVVIKALEAVGADKVITFDLHSIKIPEFFEIPVVHLSALPLFAKKIKEIIVAQGPVRSFPPASARSSLASSNELRAVGSLSTSATLRSKDVTLVSPDMGGIRRIKILSEMLGNMPYASIEKNRDLKSGKIEASKVHGVIKKQAIIVDDMISTGSTIVAAADLLSKKGAEEVVVFATHPVFSKDAHILLQKSKVKKVFVTDSIDITKEKQFEKLKILSVAEVITRTLKFEIRSTKSETNSNDQNTKFETF